MWILPKNLQLSSGAPDTAGFISDLNEQSQICASSLMARSKASPARTWLQKWKRDSWTQHLSGRILRPSHARTFVTEWTSLWPVTPASHFPQPESDSAQKTLGTSGHTSPDQYELFDLDYASLRMSKDTSVWASEKSLENWNQSVTRRRGEYSARLKSAHRTSGSGSLSWPSPIASEVRQGFQDRSRGMKGSQESLTTVVVKEQSEYPTPRTTDWKSTPNAPSNPIRVGEGTATLGEFIHAHGLPAPANPSTDGSRQGWSTPTATDASAMSPEMRPSRLATGRTTEYLARQVQWATPQAHDAQGPKTPEQIEAMRAKGHGVKNLNEQATWATPIMGDSHLASTPEVAQKRIEEGKVTLSRQTAAWATPQLQDGHNINQDSTTHKTIPAQLTKMNMAGKLNPRWVETLMGLPVGWVMPSCASPVTIEPTSFASSATESCLPQPSELFAF